MEGVFAWGPELPSRSEPKQQERAWNGPSGSSTAADDNEKMIRGLGMCGDA
jgi:hypothetical protein